MVLGGGAAVVVAGGRGGEPLAGAGLGVGRGTYRAQKCSLISVAQPSYLVLTGTLTLTPSGGSAASTGVRISTSDVATSNNSVGTITLDSGQTGPVQVDYASPVLGVIARCGGDPFSPVYSGTFLAA